MVLSLLILIANLTPLYQSAGLIKVQVNESIEMLIPGDFRPMTNDEIADRYFTTKRPMALFTDPGSSIDLGVNKSVTQWNEKDLVIMKSFQKSNIYSLYDNIEMLSEGIKEVKGRQYAYFEFISTVKEDENVFVRKGSISKYTYIQYTIIKDQSLVFNFTCPTRVHNNWKDNVIKIMSSMEVSKNFK